MPILSTKRNAVIAVTALAAFWLYLDRTCFSTVSESVRADLLIPKERMPDILAAFFLTYALFQIPVGLLADRFGPRLILTACIVGWSLVVVLMAFADSVVSLLALRFALGATEAGAYPAAAGLIKRWASPTERGRLSSYVSLGGRLGGVAAPYLTSTLAIATVGYATLGPTRPESEGNWRFVFLLFGGTGLLVAILFWLIVRDNPPSGALNQQVNTFPRKSWQQQLWLLVSSRNMWLSGLVQFMANFGWVFVITMLPTYLKEVHDTKLEDIGPMQSITLFLGASGIFFGGWLTDKLVAKLGPRAGRSIPIAVAMFGCALGYFCCALATSPWVVVFALSAMAFCVDASNPSTWAFNQDVGGKQVGAVLGWGNMLGNFGAFCSPMIFAKIAANSSWTVVFYVAGGAFLFASLCATQLNASKPIDSSESGSSG